MRQVLARLHSSSKRALLGAAACRQPAAAASTAAAAAAAAAASPPLAPGATFSATKLFSPADVSTFASVTGDSNPIHVDDAAARRLGLPSAVLPGLLSASLFPAIIGSHFPGAVYLSQTLKFKQFALVGDSLTASLTVERCSGSRVSFRTLCRRDSPGAAGAVVVEGTALALISPPPTPPLQR